MDNANTNGAFSVTMSNLYTYHSIFYILRRLSTSSEPMETETSNLVVGRK